MSQAMSSTPLLQTLDGLRFDNRFVAELPADPERENFRRNVYSACFSWVDPTTVSAPKLVSASQDMLRRLDLDHRVTADAAFTEVFSGNRILETMQPHAMCYGGHQFGHWAGQLGDGRAILLGDVINHAGERWSLQLKGAGPTPYSRSADGLAVLRSSLREFLCSEAMHHLGVPTTRALSLCLSGEEVVRDMFYDGNPAAEPGAMVCRAAPSFLRFGNFQIFAVQRDIKTLKLLVDYCIRTDFPHLGQPSRDTYLQWFEEICTRTATLLAHWQRVGFVHGVMNTDNMSILGLTIDYGPYGWLENYDPSWTPNTTDAGQRRYRYGQQPQIALWNLLQLAEAIYPLIEDTKPLEQALQHYNDHFQQGWRNTSAQKLGFAEGSEETARLYTELEKLLQMVETDMTLFFRALADFPLTQDEAFEQDKLKMYFESVWYQPQQVDDRYLQVFNQWLQLYRDVLKSMSIDPAQRRQQMNSVNPKYVLRNYLAQLAIDGVEQGDDRVLQDLMQVLQNPYDEQPQFSEYAKKRPEWARHRAGCSMLSCSS
jgi:uncharacterized protein YdiU (UPF0061 family)